MRERCLLAILRRKPVNVLPNVVTIRDLQAREVELQLITDDESVVAIRVVTGQQNSRNDQIQIRRP